MCPRDGRVGVCRSLTQRALADPLQISGLGAFLWAAEPRGEGRLPPAGGWPRRALRAPALPRGSVKGLLRQRQHRLPAQGALSEPAQLSERPWFGGAGAQRCVEAGVCVMLVCIYTSRGDRTLAPRPNPGASFPKGTSDTLSRSRAASGRNAVCSSRFPGQGDLSPGPGIGLGLALVVGLKKPHQGAGTLLSSVTKWPGL